MEVILIIMLVAAALILLPKSASQASLPQYVIIQAATPSEPVASGPGCLFWVVGGLILLTLLDIIHW